MKRLIIVLAFIIGFHSCTSDSIESELDEKFTHSVYFTINGYPDDSGSKAHLYGRITFRGYEESEVTGYGFVYGYNRSANYKEEYKKLEPEGDLSDFKATITDIPTGVDSIYYAAYVNFGKKVVFNDTIHIFSMRVGEEITTSVSSNFTGLTFERVTVYGSCSVKNPILYPITERGFCYINTHKVTGRNPTINDGRTAAGKGEGDFSATITGLEPGGAYKVKAYAINSKGVTYSTTYVTIPVILSDAFRPLPNCRIDLTNNLICGDIILDNEYYVTEKGFCYTTNGRAPTVDDYKIEAGSGLGTFSIPIDFAPGKYYFRSYAINEAGCGYSNVHELVVPNP